MKKPDWKDAPDWSSKLMIGRTSGKYAWFGDGDVGAYTDSNGLVSPECHLELVENRPTDRPHPAAVHAIDPEEPDSDLVNLHHDPADAAFKGGWRPICESAYPKYVRNVSGLEWIDVYSVCHLFGVDDTSGATHHAIKKLLLSGTRNGGKSKLQDITEARDTLNRLIEILGMDVQ